jgi:hypothetical protein
VISSGYLCIQDNQQVRMFSFNCMVSRGGVLCNTRWLCVAMSGRTWQVGDCGSASILGRACSKLLVVCQARLSYYWCHQHWVMITHHHCSAWKLSAYMAHCARLTCTLVHHCIINDLIAAQSLVGLAMSTACTWAMHRSQRKVLK